MHTVKTLIRKIINSFVPTENLVDSKKKWNSLAEKNAAYFVMTDYGEGITEEQFRTSGMKNYEQLIGNDSLITSRLSPFGSKDVMEIGCGIGRITEFLSKNFKTVSAVDISEEMVRKGSQRLSGSKNIVFKATDGTSFPFTSSSFDFVFSFIVFQHMPDTQTIEKNIAEISRVLRPGGIAKIQLRGLPTSKKNWYYGPSFSVADARKLIKNLPLTMIKSDGEGQRYFWIWLEKTK
jgi:ubiquinone/menaquinone biosynthesis C-methylase UbiE